MADRFGVFVDAGYLFAASGALCFGMPDRTRLVMDCKIAVEALVELASESCGLSHLRTYWYDGAKDAQPIAQQLDVAHLPAVKLRLGRLVKGKQKGVDSRIVRDLIILSEERAMSVAYLVGGDEDLREGVSEAQERGVRVVLVAVEPPTAQNLSPTLAMEADDVIVLNRQFVESFICVRPEGTGVSLATTMDHEATPLSLGREFATQLLARTRPDEVVSLRRNRPRVPSQVDREMLAWAAAALGNDHIDDGVRKEIRIGFWEAILADPSFPSL